ncbi:SHD1 domain-containing protein [Rubripirellula amarantea]|nr:SHD1 domain-containing protein [Rubripirellula amarantea]
MLKLRFPSKLRCAVASAMVFVFFDVSARGQELGRVWVDASGLHSITATLVRVENDSVVLLRADGGEVKLPLGQLSHDDQKYVSNYSEKITAENGLRSSPPPKPEVEPLEALELPQALFESAENSVLELGPALVMAGDVGLPRSLPADRSRFAFGCQDINIEMDKLDFTDDRVSRPIPIITTDKWDTRTTSVIISASTQVRFMKDTARHQVVRFDFQDGRRVVAMQHDRNVALLDHDHDNQRSLVLVDHGPVGDGGKLALAEGWQADNLRITNARAVPGASPIQTQPKVRWARFVDAQHVIVAIDSSVVLWNLVSGEPIYRIANVDLKATPALSGGHRYLAIPSYGKVDLHETATGKRLGQIKIEPKLPAVSFSPYGDSLAISTSRRIRVWNLPGAALDYDVQARESLGREPTVWVNHELLLTSSGVLMSLPMGLPIWKYDVTACEVASLGEHVAILRREPIEQLVTVKLPHPAAQVTLEHLRSSSVDIDESSWRIAGRSMWNGTQWVDRDVRIGAKPISRR